MALSRAQRDAAINSADAKTQQDFASEIASRTRLTTTEVTALAKTEAERQALSAVIAVVAEATASNQAKAEQIRQIAGGLETLVKIASKLV